MPVLNSNVAPSRFWPIPFSPPLEEQTLPSVDRVREAILALAAF